jgi:hypothetical protein
VAGQLSNMAKKQPGIHPQEIKAVSATGIGSCLYTCHSHLRLLKKYLRLLKRLPPSPIS